MDIIISKLPETTCIRLNCMLVRIVWIVTNLIQNGLSKTKNVLAQNIKKPGLWLQV